MKVFDGHNDTILRLYSDKENKQSFFGETDLHIDMQKAKEGDFSGGFFAMFTPNENYEVEPKDYLTDTGEYDVPLPPQIDQSYALKHTNALAAKLFKTEKESNGKFKIVRTADELAYCLENNILAAIFHIEGAEAINTDLNTLHVLHKAGLRSLGIVWSRQNAFGEGVPFRYPSSPDIGGGLTTEGKHLVRECNKLGIVVDNTHLNEKGFWDVARLTDAPIVATHSNAHTLCPISRNLTDKQLATIQESNGVVGVNYAVNMLREDGGLGTDISLDEIVRHVAYIAEKFGVDHVALGSDFDGTHVPDELQNAAGLQKLVNRLKTHGFSDAELKKITHQNWVRVLRDTWK